MIKADPSTLVAGLLALLEQGRLATWYAIPLESEPAMLLRDQARDRLRAAYAAGQRDFPAQLAELVARFWLGRTLESEIQNLLAVLDSERERALLALVYGQLRLACKQQGAWRYLDRGFNEAANLLEADEYFQVLKRHERLRRLPLHESPAAPQLLRTLLAEAELINRLEGPRLSRPDSTEGGHLDTLD
jgi:hypothetical protein